MQQLFVSTDRRKSNAEVEAMKRQAKGLALEYDRLLREHHQLQVNAFQTSEHFPFDQLIFTSQ